VILCGGVGTRLWPLSRRLYPKQLLPLLGEESLLQQTARRLSGKPFAPPIIVAAENQRFFISRQLGDVDIAPEAILLEPDGRNTAAAGALAAAWLNSTGRDEVLLISPSDHAIGDRPALLKAIEAGVAQAEEGAIVAFGIRATEPQTEYGYIEFDPDGEPGEALPIARFVEKPSADKAMEYLASGRFLWNSGLFLVKASSFLGEVKAFMPDTVAAISESVANTRQDGPFVRPASGPFRRIESMSIDHGIMERTSRGVVVPVDMDWSDVGSWEAVWQLGPKDSGNNVMDGKVVALDTRDSLLRSDGRAVVAAIGLEKMAVVAVSDAVLIAPIDRLGDMRKLVEQVEAAHGPSLAAPPKVARPWGSYEVIAAGAGFQVKHVVVDPGQALSLQLHRQRSEHWTVIRGSAEVTIGDKTSVLREHETAVIPIGMRHRLANPGDVPLELVEVQSGAYSGEDDIVRFDDL